MHGYMRHGLKPPGGLRPAAEICGLNQNPHNPQGRGADVDAYDMYCNEFGWD